MLKKSYKVLSKKELSKVFGGWGYGLSIRSNWRKSVWKWFKG